MLNALLSFIIGIFGAWIFSGIIFENFKGGAITIAVSAVTLLTEKTAKFIMYRFDIDLLLTSIIELIFEKIKSILK